MANGDKRDRMARKASKRAAHGRIRTMLRAMLRSGIDCDPIHRIGMPDLILCRKLPAAELARRYGGKPDPDRYYLNPSA